MSLPLVNVLGLSSSVRVLHYIQVLCQYRLCKADDGYLTYLREGAVSQESELLYE
jgi:hypothetical protein